MIRWLSKYVAYPLWDLWDHSSKLNRFRELQELQWQPLATIKGRQWDKLQALLRYAGEHSPYYKQLFAEHGIDVAAIKSSNDMPRIPLTHKQTLRDRVDDFISNEYTKESLISAKTGGSTGQALVLYFDKRCQEYRNAAAYLSDYWAGWEFGHAKAAIWGNPPVFVTAKQKLRNALLDRLFFLDTMAMHDQSMTAFIERCQAAREPYVIFGHSHSIFLLAKFINDNGRVINTPPAGIVATSMMLLAPERAEIERAFNCTVSDRYGCEEVGLIGAECEQHHGMHLNIEDLYIEFVDSNGVPVAPGEMGKLVLTDLNNKAMPLIRYSVEDIGLLSDRTCSCGRGWPLMEQLCGRTADFLKRRDGSKVAGVSLVERTLTAIPGLDQMQIIQRELDRLQLNVVKGKDFTSASEQALRDEFSLVFGDGVEITIEYLGNIAQSRNGKYRFSICEI